MAALPRKFYERATVDVAKDLLGQVLRFGATSGIIVETEAYLGADDLAAHSARGLTSRTRVIFGPPGHAYIYLIYGMYECLNIVAEPEGKPGCVLIRALEPVEGIEIIRRRRPAARKVEDLASGPGKLTLALGITREMNGADVTKGKLVVHEPMYKKANRHRDHAASRDHEVCRLASPLLYRRKPVRQPSLAVLRCAENGALGDEGNGGLEHALKSALLLDILCLGRPYCGRRNRNAPKSDSSRHEHNSCNLDHLDFSLLVNAEISLQSAPLKGQFNVILGTMDEKRYGELLAEYRPRLIESSEEHERLLTIAETLMEKGDQLGQEEELLLALIVLLIEAFETHVVDDDDGEDESPAPHMTLQRLMQSNSLELQDVADVFGNPYLAREVLEGKRPISRNQAKELGRLFQVPSKLFEI